MLQLFVSDLHLDASRPEATAAFLRFLQETAPQAQALYILGDLFEYWIGDDQLSAHDCEVAAALAALSSTGVRCYLMHGNRDFLLGVEFAEQAAVTLLHDPTLIYAGTDSVLISHGDQYCTDDISYQRFRSIVRAPWVTRLFRLLPIGIRKGIAASARARSRKSQTGKAAEILDVSQLAIEQAMREFNVQLLLHGHTHRPGMHEFNLDGQPAKRIVLGDWYQQGSVLHWDENGPNLVTLEF